MPAHKTFTTAAARPEEGTGLVTFDLDGEEFSAYAVLPLDAMLDLADITIADKEKPTVAEIVTAGRAVQRFMAQVLTHESALRYAARMKGETEGYPPVTLDTSSKIARWLIEDVYTGRPTVPSSDTPSG